MHKSSGRRTVGPLAVFAASVALFAGCGGSGVALPQDPAAALRAVQSAVDRSGGYTLDVEQSNFVLPRWGGSDSGNVGVDGKGTAALARLARTGEPDATYAIVLVDGVTYFTRSTCQDSFRVPGGSADVLSPFLFTKTQSLAKASNPRREGDTIFATMDSLGPVTISVDPKTNRPTLITGSTTSGPFSWQFSAWGRAPSVSPPAGRIADRGPGGVPC